MASSVVVDEFKVRRLTSDHGLEVRVSFTKEFFVRKAVAFWLIKLAAMVLGCSISIAEDTADT